MKCLHPNCPMGEGLPSWEAVLDGAGIRPAARAGFLAQLVNARGNMGENVWIGQRSSGAALERLLELAPCLYTQVPARASARAMVHLCEVTLGAQIISSNVAEAFDIQNPIDSSRTFTHPAITPCTDGGGIMEALCSEVLTNHGVPPMPADGDDWPIWGSPCHLPLNRGKASRIKLYGDILIPCLPHNLLISVKSVSARERLMVSGNRLESIGFGFFSDPSEFWTPSRISLYRRWGFTAIYMPESTIGKIAERLDRDGNLHQAININGNPLYRPLGAFGPDMRRISGRIALDL